jgi:hypothetical protein
MKWSSSIVLLALLACGAAQEPAPGASSKASTGEQDVDRDVAASSAAGDSAAAASSPRAAEASPSGSGEPDTPEEVVVALIRAMQSADRGRAEALHYRDAKRWSDQAGFEKRVEYYRRIDFDLDSIETERSEGGAAVTARGVRNGEEYVYSFLVGRFDGRLQAGELHEGWIEENLGGNQPRR